jgi:hypothetical protein
LQNVVTMADLARRLLRALSGSRTESEHMAFSDEWMVGGVTEGSEQSLQILARSIVREMKRSGYSKAQMVGLASEVIDLVSRELRAESSASNPPA